MNRNVSAPRKSRLKLLLLTGVLVVMMGIVAIAWVGTVAFQWGRGVVQTIQDGPAAAFNAAVTEGIGPQAVGVLKWKLACIELAGGPDANAVLEKALTLAPTETQKLKIQEFGKDLGLPRQGASSAAQLAGQCLRFQEKPAT